MVENQATMWPISRVKPNPLNPRVIRDDSFKKLVKSLLEFPDMAQVRPVVVNQDGIILGGNMRFRAMQQAGWTQIPTIQVDWTEDKQKEFIIKDNVGFGEWDWDSLANDWNPVDLEQWGLPIPSFDDNPPDESITDATEDEKEESERIPGATVMVRFKSESLALEGRHVIAEVLSKGAYDVTINQH